MKSFLLICSLCLYFLAKTNAAAIDPVVEEQPATVEAEEPKIALSDVHEDCHQPRETGRCFGLFQRYGFNTETLKCEQFIYGGCGGNNNRFESLEDCEKKCLKKENSGEKPEDSTEHQSVSVTQVSPGEINCNEPIEAGRCFGVLHLYGFNGETQKCEEFVYGGCGGNSNRFSSVEECEQKCLQKDSTEKAIDISTEKDGEYTTEKTSSEQQN